MGTFVETPNANVQQKSALGRFFVVYQSLRPSQRPLGRLSNAMQTEHGRLILQTDTPTAYALSIEGSNKDSSIFVWPHSLLVVEGKQCTHLKPFQGQDQPNFASRFSKNAATASS